VLSFLPCCWTAITEMADTPLAKKEKRVLAKGKKDDLAAVPQLPPVPQTGQSTFTFSNGAVYEGSWRVNNIETSGSALLFSGSSTSTSNPPNASPRSAAPTTSAVPSRQTVKVRHGFGRWSYLGDVYSGDWLDDGIEGNGEIQFSTGARYKGSWVKNRYHGYGEYQWPDQSNYKGEWRENRMNGKGTLILSDGQRWEGIFQNDKFINESGQWTAPPLPLHFSQL